MIDNIKYSRRLGNLRLQDHTFLLFSISRDCYRGASRQLNNVFDYIIIYKVVIEYRNNIKKRKMV
jgi:hypothetical protein